MSDNHANGDNAPRNLRQAFSIMRREVHRIERTARRQRKAGFTKSPRQYCAVCGKVYDFAIVDPNATITAAICADCKKVLAEGYTACVTLEEYAFVKSPHLTENGLAGKVVAMTPENFAEIRKKFKNETDVPNPESPGPA